MPFYPETRVLNLAPDETLLLADKVLYTCNGGKKEPATLFFSDKNTLYCVTTKGTIKKTYTLVHNYLINPSTDRFWVEKPVWGLGRAVLCTDITFSDGRVTFRYYPQAAAPFNASQWHEAMELQKGYYLKQFQLIETYLSILRSQEETYFSQLKDVYCSIFGGTQQDIPDESIANDIRYFINNGDIEGMLSTDEAKFIHKQKYERTKETFIFNVATSIEIDPATGTMKIKCPHCGGVATDISGNTITCAYCSKTYMVPKKIYDML